MEKKSEAALREKINFFMNDEQVANKFAQSIHGCVKQKRVNCNGTIEESQNQNESGDIRFLIEYLNLMQKDPILCEAHNKLYSYNLPTNMVELESSVENLKRKKKKKLKN